MILESDCMASCAVISKRCYVKWPTQANGSAFVRRLLLVGGLDAGSGFRLRLWEYFSLVPAPIRKYFATVKAPWLLRRHTAAFALADKRKSAGQSIWYS